MGKKLSVYFLEVEDSRVTGRCWHLLSDILMISLLTYLTGGTDYQDMHLFAKDSSKNLGYLLNLVKIEDQAKKLHYICTHINFVTFFMIAYVRIEKNNFY